jgi:hypothetical protein
LVAALESQWVQVLALGLALVREMGLVRAIARNLALGLGMALGMALALVGVRTRNLALELGLALVLVRARTLRADFGP